MIFIINSLIIITVLSIIKYKNKLNFYLCLILYMIPIGKLLLKYL